MSSVKINESLWNALSDEERETILSYFNAGNLGQEVFSVVRDPNIPVPKSDSRIYSITENELHNLTDEELKCRIKYHMDAAKGLAYCIDTYNNAALLVCCIFIIEKYKQNVSCLCELSDEVSAICDSIVSKLKNSVSQSKDAKDFLYEVTIGDIAVRKLFYGKRSSPPLAEAHPPVLAPWARAHPPVHTDYSMFGGASWDCWMLCRCRNGKYFYPCGSCG